MMPHRFVIAGERSGPRLLILGGVHGDEYEPIAAIRRLAECIDAKQLAGQVTLVPLVNEPAFAAQARTAEDGLDLARTFPGSPDGTVTQQIAAAIAAMIQEADFLIDLHTGGLAVKISPLAGYMLIDNPAVLDQQRTMARAFGLPIIWGTTAKLDGRSLSVARDAKVPAIYAEWGGGGGCDTAGVNDYVQGCLNVLAELKMLPRSVAAAPRHTAPLIVEDPSEGSGHLQVNYPAPHAGYYEPTTQIDQQVGPGDELGRLYRLPVFAPTIVRSNQAGRLILCRWLPAVKPGDSLAVVLETSAQEDG